MEWTADHHDGFTERLLNYRVHCVDGLAELEAHWFHGPGPDDPFRTLFEVDDGPIARSLPALRLMDERYEARWDDLDIKSLIVDSGGETIRRRVDGGGVLVLERPELRPFLELFRWLEGQALAQLPPGR